MNKMGNLTITYAELAQANGSRLELRERVVGRLAELQDDGMTSVYAVREDGMRGGTFVLWDRSPLAVANLVARELGGFW